LPSARRFSLPSNAGGQPRLNGGRTQGLEDPRKERSQGCHRDK
jgi:hypothetical protein